MTDREQHMEALAKANEIRRQQSELKRLCKFWTRRKARKIERELQRELLGNLTADGMPLWARGVRVEKLGRASWCVVATERRGR